MKTAIISPHTDDAIFSLGSTLYNKTLDEVAIITPFAGIPADDAGKKKHTILRAEHTKACKELGVEEINGEFFDDVYPDRELNNLEGWLRKVIKGFDRVIIPLGIHHPDHVLIRNIFIDSGIRFSGFYAELPYRMLYPEIFTHLRNTYTLSKMAFYSDHDPMKNTFVEAYASQIIGGHILQHLYVEERFWL